jgi:hypothetical protein
MRNFMAKAKSKWAKRKERSAVEANPPLDRARIPGDSGPIFAETRAVMRVKEWKRH